MLGHPHVASFIKSFFNYGHILCLMKLREFQQHLREQKIDGAFLVHPDPYITYFTQTNFSYAYLLITPHNVRLYLTKLDQKPSLPGITVKVIQKGWQNQFHPVRLGINKAGLTVRQLEELKKTFPGTTYVDLAKVLGDLRSRKTDIEIKKIATACDITANALYALVKELPVKRLQTEQDVALFLERKFREQESTTAFPTIVAMGKNAAIPHHVTSNQKLSRGFLVIDFGASYQNYCADMTRVLFLGKPTAKEKEWYALLLNAQQQAIDAVQDGVPFSQLDGVARHALGKYSSHFIHSLGHGIGLEVHEAPQFSDKVQKVQSRQVFTIEPGIYFPGKFGLRIEDTLVFDGKTTILTTFPKQLIGVDF